MEILMRKQFCDSTRLTLLMLAFSGPLHAQSLGSAFSYQGQLKEAGVPASGLYDIQACLFSTFSGATSLLLCAQDSDDVPVSAGLFSVALDFGAATFVGQQRYLELRVRPGASTGSYTVLSPRQLLRATPEALRANVASAAPWSGLTGVPAGFADNTDNDSGGTVTSVSAGTGLSGGAITGSGTIGIANGGVTGLQLAAAAVGTPQLANGAVTSEKLANGAVGLAQVNTAQIQTRISGSCGAGDYLRGINADGSLNCELLPVSFDRVLDSSNDVGSSVSIALRSDGRPVIAHHNNTSGWLKLYSCSDAACVTGISRILDIAGADVGEDTSVAIRPNGLPVIVYRDVAAQALKLFDCTTETCSTGVARILDDSVDVSARNTSMVLRADGRPFIAYYEFTNFTVRAYDCANVSCSSGVVCTLSGGGVTSTDVQIRADGRPLIAVGGNPGAGTRVRLYDCTNLDCTTATVRAPPSTPSAAPVALLIRSNDRPLIATTGLSGNLTMSDCADAICSSTLQTILTTGTSFNTVAMKLRSNGFPLIAYGDVVAANQSDLALFDCSNTSCTAGSIRTIVSNGDFGAEVALALRADDRPVIAYYDALNDDLRLRVCANPECL
jgi:hypothetical protein